MEHGAARKENKVLRDARVLLFGGRVAGGWVDARQRPDVIRDRRCRDRIFEIEPLQARPGPGLHGANWQFNQASRVRIN